MLTVIPPSWVIFWAPISMPSLRVRQYSFSNAFATPPSLMSPATFGTAPRAVRTSVKSLPSAASSGLVMGSRVAPDAPGLAGVPPGPVQPTSASTPIASAANAFVAFIPIPPTVRF